MQIRVARYRKPCSNTGPEDGGRSDSTGCGWYASCVEKAAKDKGVQRVVVTSSFAAIGYGNSTSAEVYTENDWSDPTSTVISPYIKSIFLAERAAWDYINTEGKPMELTTINPTVIFGPLLGSDLSTAHEILKQFFDGTVPALPKTSLRIVDVRDVADLHVAQ